MLAAVIRERNRDISENNCSENEKSSIPVTGVIAARTYVRTAAMGAIRTVNEVFKRNCLAFLSNARPFEIETKQNQKRRSYQKPWRL